jgi:hypothetical protein
MENQAFEELKIKLRSLSAMLIMDGIGSKNGDKLVLGNSLSLALATIDLGPDLKSDLLLALNPIAEKVKDEMLKKFPDTKPKTATVTANEIPELRETVKKLMDMESAKVDIEGLLTGTGVSITQDDKG